MRRRGLRDRIRHQRRLTRRLVARHVLARRAHAAARMLDALGAWSVDDEPVGTVRFVPPLVDQDLASITTAREVAQVLPAPSADVDDVENWDSEPGVEPSEPDIGDLPNAETAPWPIPEPAAARKRSEPVVRPEAPGRPSAAPNGDRASRTTPEVAPPTRPAVARSVAAPPSRAADAARPSRPLGAPPTPIADRAVPIVARPDRVVPPELHRAREASAAPGDAKRSAPRSDPAAPARPTNTAESRPASDATPNVTDVPATRGPVAQPEPTQATASGGHAAGGTTAAEAPTPTPPAPERTAHSEVVQRAVEALRARGELAPSKSQTQPKPRPAAAPQAPASPVTPASARPTSVPPSTRPPQAKTQPERPAAPPDARTQSSPTVRAAQDNLAPDKFGTEDLPSDDLTPLESSTTDEVMPDVTAAAPTTPSGDATAAAMPEAEAPRLDPPREAAAADRAATVETTPPPPAKARASSPVPSQPSHAEDRPAASSTGLRVDEQRQARRPAHLDRARPEATTSASPTTSPPARDTTPPLSGGPDRAHEGQFQFADPGRTPQEWRQLLIEATSPPRPKPRPAPTPKQENVAASRSASSPTTPNTVATATTGRAVPAPQTSSRPTSPNVARRTPDAGLTRVRPNDPAARPAPAQPHRAPTTTATPALNRTEPTSLAPTRETADPTAPAADTDAPSENPDSPLSPEAVADAMRAIPTEPLAPSTRRFLRPLLGIDPDSVRIHRGERAAQLADAHGADAIAVGDDIAISAGHDERDPKTIALLAHELTHAARARDRRFVPPVARGTQPAAASPATASATSRVRTPSRGTAPVDDEEAIAEAVEARVRGAATREREQAVSITPNADVADDELVYLSPDDETEDDASETLDVQPRSASAPASRRADARRSPWGTLPAPWEPLPPSLISNRPDNVVSSVTTAAPTPSPTPSAAPVESAPVVHRAEHGSGSAGEAPAHAEPPAEAGAGPDIDALARQVYNVLKRRLAAESRRGA